MFNDFNFKYQFIIIMFIPVQAFDFILYSGEHCFPKEILFPYGLAGGFAMTNSKDAIVSCFGFNETKASKGFLISI